MAPPERVNAALEDAVCSKQQEKELYKRPKKKKNNPSFLSNVNLDLQLVDAIGVDAKPANCRHGFQ